MLNGPAQGQDTWEYSPYRVRVWLAVRPAAELPAQVQDEILTQLRLQSRIYAGVTWQLEAISAPTALQATLVTSLPELTVEQIAAADSQVFSMDKLILLTVREEQGDFVLASRELDCQARSLSQVVHARTLQRTRLARDCAAAMARAFCPLVRVEQSRGIQATVRVRAGGLVQHEHCVSRVGIGDVLRPVIRRNDRLGDPKPGGIQEIDWTYLTVQQQEDYLLQCEVRSAMRNPLEGRSSASVEKMALLVRPQGNRTTLRLVAKGEAAKPLEGYEIFAKKPLPKDSEEENAAVRLGLTDWRGMIEVPREDSLLRLIYVKNGTHLIARLPVVPGYLPRETVEIPSDDKRLETEAFVKGMESTVMDLVARREILAARIRRRLEQGKIDEARQLLEEIKLFQTRDDLELMLTSRQRAGLASSNEREQQRIDHMLSGIRILLHKYLDPDLLVDLQREVEQGKPAQSTKTATQDVAQDAAVEQAAPQAEANPSP